MMQVMMIYPENILNEFRLFIKFQTNKIYIYKQSEKIYYEKSRFRKTQGAIIDQKYNAIHVHDELIFIQTAASF